MFNKLDITSPIRFVVLKPMLEYAGKLPKSSGDVDDTHPVVVLVAQLGDISKWIAAWNVNRHDAGEFYSRLAELLDSVGERYAPDVVYCITFRKLGHEQRLNMLRLYESATESELDTVTQQAVRG